MTSTRRASTHRAEHPSLAGSASCTATCSVGSRVTNGPIAPSRRRRTWCSSMSRRLEIALLALLTLAVALAVWAGSRRAGTASSFDFRPSTLLRGPEGSGGLYDVLVRLRIPLERRRAPLFDLAHERRRPPAVLVVLDPFMHLEAAELGQVVRLVRAGGRVVAAGSGGGITRCAGWVTAPAGRFVASDSVPGQSPAPRPPLAPRAGALQPPR